ncbi:MAG: hypothetical protein WBG89_14485 [Ornithinimicrobium sp.]
MSALSWLATPRAMVLMPGVAAGCALMARDYMMAGLFAVALLVALAFWLVGATRHAVSVIDGADEMIEDHRAHPWRDPATRLRSTSTSA